MNSKHDRRGLRRISNKFGPELTATLSIGGELFYVEEVLDYNSLGVSLLAEKSFFAGNAKHHIDDLKMMFGDQTVCQIKNPQIIGIYPEKNKLILSLNSEKKSSVWNNRENRVDLAFSFQGSVYGVDPFTLDQTLVFRMSNISAEGCALISSKSNRHLTVGLKMLHYTLMLPGYDLMTISFEIKSIQDTGSHLKLGCKFILKDKKFEKNIKKFIFTNSQLNLYNSDDAQEVRTNVKSINKFGSWIRIRKVTSESEYENVLKIRYEAYKAASKVESHSTWNDMKDEYDDHSIIYLAYVGQTAAGTIRLVFRDSYKKLPFENFINLETLNEVDSESIAEVTRFAVHPHFQGTDVFFALFRKIIFEIGAKKIKSPVCLATKKLSVYYKGIGAQAISKEFSHPTLENETLTLYLFDPKKIAEGRMSALGWFFVARPALTLLEKFGFVKRSKTEILKYPQLIPEALSVLFHKLKKRFTK